MKKKTKERGREGHPKSPHTQKGAEMREAHREKGEGRLQTEVGSVKEGHLGEEGHC